MADNAIDLIREAELEAEKILHDAALEATRLKDEAYAEACRIAQLHQQEASTAAAVAVCAAREACREHLDAEAVNLQQEIEALRLKAQSRRESAIEALVSSLV